MHRSLATALLAALAATAGASPLESLVGKVAYNRDIYRLVMADGGSFRIKNLAGLTLVRIEQADGREVPWFLVEGSGEARPSPADIERIEGGRREGKLPADWSWVHAADPRAKHAWDEKFWKAIEDRTIIHEMTPEMVRLAFGEPDRINVNRRPENVQEHWIYSTGSIWFVEGKVFTWQAP